MEYKNLLMTMNGNNLDARQLPTISEKLLENNIIHIYGEINCQLSHQVNTVILYMQAVNPKTSIKLYINSPGGSIVDGMAIIDTCNIVSNPIETYGCGMCASMGAMILAAAAPKGSRYLLPSCEVMLHQPLGGASGQATEIILAAQRIQKSREKLYNILSKITGKNVDVITNDFDRDKWFNAGEAIEYGLADKIIKVKKNSVINY